MEALYYLSGDIATPGTVSVPKGMTVRQIIDELGGGMANGKACKAVQIGGCSSGILTAEELDTPFDFKALAAYGIRRGDSTITVYDEDRCMVQAVQLLLKRTQVEFCGRCVSCREGTKRMTEMMQVLLERGLSPKEFTLLTDIGEMVSVTAFCALGKGSYKTLEKAIRCFGDEFQAHLDGHCDLCEKSERLPVVPGGIPYDRKLIRIDPEKCRGCSKCARMCHAEAITGVIKSPFSIDSDKCARCYSCLEGCPFGAIEEVDING